jgi:micrococcal nuclease
VSIASNRNTAKSNIVPHGMMKRALATGALFLFSLAAHPQTSPDPACQAYRLDEQVRIKHVSDGDSLVLSDGRKVRLIGINTPELKRDGRPAEPLAIDAHHALQEFLHTHGNVLLLQLGRDKTDRYGRQLAHAFTFSGINVSAWLLKQGLGYHIAISPNLWGRECYRNSEVLARKQNLGVWKYPPVKASELSASSQGFMRLVGQVLSQGESRKAYWLNLPGSLGVRIGKKDLHNFKHPLSWYVNKTIVVRGWVSKSNKGLYMNIYHPDAIELTHSP